MKSKQSVACFDTRFQKQVASGDYALNPFEKVALPCVRGRLLDYGCGLGNLSVNVLIEGTTFMGMFEPGSYCLFGRGELQEQFKGWVVLHHSFDSFDAPGNTKKEFATIVARRSG